MAHFFRGSIKKCEWMAPQQEMMVGSFLLGRDKSWKYFQDVYVMMDGSSQEMMVGSLLRSITTMFVFIFYFGSLTCFDFIDWTLLSQPCFVKKYCFEYRTKLCPLTLIRKGPPEKSRKASRKVKKMYIPIYALIEENPYQFGSPNLIFFFRGTPTYVLCW